LSSRRRQALAAVRCTRDLLLLLRLISVAALVPPLMRLRLSTVSRLLTPQRWAGVRGGDAIDVERLVACFDAARILAHPIVRPGCLTRAVTLYWFLVRRGLDVELWFGVARENGEAIGHAWLVHEGIAFLEPTDPVGRFTVTYRIGVIDP